MDAKILNLKGNENKYYKYLVDDDKMKSLKEEKILEKISETRSEIEQLENKKRELCKELDRLKHGKKNALTLVNLLKAFDATLGLVDTEKQKQMLHSIIKEIKITKSDKP